VAAVAAFSSPRLLHWIDFWLCSRKAVGSKNRIRQAESLAHRNRGSSFMLVADTHLICPQNTQITQNAKEEEIEVARIEEDVFCVVCGQIAAKRSRDRQDARMLRPDGTP
jgi:hypothetical protein